MVMTAREAAWTALQRWRKNGAWSDAALNAVLQSAQLEPRDAALAARICYGTLQNLTLLDHCLSAYCTTSLQKLDPSVESASLTLGASHFTTLRRVVFPQVLPGILSGSLIVFGLAASSFAIPGLLGGRRFKMVATLIYDEYLHELNWPLGAAIAFVLLAANLVIMLGWNRMVEGRYKKTLG